MTIKEIASMIDISAVRAESTWNEIEDILQATRKYPFICIFSMPSMLDRILPYRKEIPNLRIGGIVGFPSGGETLETKLFEAKQLKEKGCDEIDMVLNIGKLKSGFVEEVKDEIMRVLTTPGLITTTGKLVINDIYERFENIYKGYSIEKIYNNYTYKGEGIQDIDKQFFMYPYAGIRIEFTLTTRELCQRYIL